MSECIYRLTDKLRIYIHAKQTKEPFLDLDGIRAPARLLDKETRNKKSSYVR